MSGKRSPEEFKIGALVDNRKQSGGYDRCCFHAGVH
jgi:hypothetical protein